MRSRYWIAAGALALLFTGCAAVDQMPDARARQDLAPTGKLRVGFLVVNPIHAVKDASSGEMKGPAVDLGRAMAGRLGVPFEPVPYTAIPPLIAGAKAGEWDVAMMGINSERAELLDFTAPYMVVQFGYLLPAGSSVPAAGDLDAQGVRIAVVEKGTPDLHLSRTLKRAALVRVRTPAEMNEMLLSRKVHAAYGVKANMVSQAGKLPGSRVLDDRGGEETGIAVPKGRGAGATYARQFVESAKAEGLVKTAIDKADLRGVVVAPSN